MKESIRNLIEKVTKSGQNVHRPMTLFFSTLFFITFFIAIGLVVRVTEDIFHEHVDDQLNEVQRFYQEQISDQAELQELIVTTLLSDKELVRSVESQSDFNKFNSIFESLKPYNITHLYVFSTDRVVVHRAHSPDRKGDTINRSNLLKAEMEQRMITGLELGKIGAFTLRSSSPVFKDKVLIGYIEVGMELGHVATRTEQQFDVMLYEFFDKDVATAKDRVKLHPLADRRAERDLVPGFIINAAPDADFSSGLIDEILNASKLEQHEAIVESTAIITLDIHNFSGEKVGFMAIASDITEFYQERNKDFFQIGIIGALLGLFSIVAINQILRYLEQSIKNYSNKQRRSEEELKQSFQRLKDTQELIIEQEKFASLGSMVAGIAHEVNTPLGIGLTAGTAIKHELDKLENQLNEKTLTQASLKEISSNMRSMSDLIDKNLHRAANLVSSFKQVAVDQSSEQARDVQMGKLLNEIVTSLEPQLKKKQHHANVKCDEALVIRTIPGYWSQILFNLINNSIIHGFEGVTGKQIDINMEIDGPMLVMTYKDNGKGIPDKDRKKIFEPFFTTKRNEGGSGLGMHLVFNIVTQALKGNIELLEAEQGVHFRLSLMLA